MFDGGLKETFQQGKGRREGWQPEEKGGEGVGEE